MTEKHDDVEPHLWIFFLLITNKRLGFPETIFQIISFTKLRHLQRTERIVAVSVHVDQHRFIMKTINQGTRNTQYLLYDVRHDIGIFVATSNVLGSVA